MLRELQVTEVSLFGSVARGDATIHSDIDLLIEFSPGFRFGLGHLTKVEELLERHLPARVDLVLRHCVYPDFAPTIFGEAIRAA